MGWWSRLRSRWSGSRRKSPEQDPAGQKPGWAQATLFEGANRTLLAIANRHGTVEHFYHFVLGFLAPLVLFLERAPPRRHYLVRSCGPMDAHLAALGLSAVETMPKAEHLEALKQKILPREKLHGFDKPEFYDREAFAQFRAAMFSRLSIAPPETAEDTALLIDRGEASTFYNSAEAESKTAARQRRWVPNMGAIGEKLGASGVPNRVECLEHMPLRAQISLFAGTRLLVAQHGAALVHMLWMPPGSAVVEIMPAGIAKSEYAPFFSALAACCGHAYATVEQKTAHARVKPALVLAAVEQARQNPPGAQEDTVEPGPEQPRAPEMLAS